MTVPTRKIAINNAGNYLPGLNSVLLGVLRAAGNLGWKVVGIRDGFDGLLFPDRYSEGGVVPLTLEWVETVSASGTPLLGTSASSDPFHVRTINAENQIEEIDRSEELLQKIGEENIAAVISVAGIKPLSILFKLHRIGLNSICVPASVENNVAATELSFGFNSTLSSVVSLLDNARHAAQASRKIGVVEVLGENTGWLALQAGIATGADVVLIPEIPYDLSKVADTIRNKFASGRRHAFVVVAEGARCSSDASRQAGAQQSSLKASLAPLATGDCSAHVMDRSGQLAETVALELQRSTDQQTYPLALGQLIKGGAPTAVDQQLGVAYGAAAVRGIKEGQNGALVSFQPPELKFVPLVQAINKVRPIPLNSVFVETARTLGICLGD
jgi:6-phosphofructokinase 1